MTQFFKEEFTAGLKDALITNFSDAHEALLELVDNAVDDCGTEKTLHVDIDLEDESVTIKNNFGKGMSLEQLGNFFKWGKSDKRKRIGRYGQGGKAAIGYLGKDFSIETHKAGDDLKYFANIKDWDKNDGKPKEIEVNSHKTDSKDGYVKIEITRLKRNFSEDKVKHKIAKIYRPLIKNGTVKFRVKGNEVFVPTINYDNNPEKFSTELTVNKQTIRGEFGIVSDKNCKERGGFNVYQFGRLVADKEYFGHSDVTKKWSALRLYGELNIDFEIPLVMNKTDIDRDSDEWKEIEEKMYFQIKEILKDTKKTKQTTKKEKDTADKVEKKVNEHIEDEAIDIEVAPYGPGILYKIREEKDKVKLIINRDHKAYKKWRDISRGVEMYSIMLYSLYNSSKDMKKREAKKFITAFSESLQKTSEILK